MSISTHLERHHVLAAVVPDLEDAGLVVPLPGLWWASKEARVCQVLKSIRRARHHCLGRELANQPQDVHDTPPPCSLCQWKT